jgi:transposase
MGKEREMMKCNVCIHSAQSEIDKALVQGVSLRNIAKQYGVSYSAVGRHAKTCIGQSLAVAKVEREKENGATLRGELETLNEKCQWALDERDS